LHGINIIAYLFSGSGTFSAAGNDGGDGSGDDGGGGAGGRIVVYYNESTFTGSADVSGGLGGDGSVAGQPGSGILIDLDDDVGTILSGFRFQGGGSAANESQNVSGVYNTDNPGVFTFVNLTVSSAHVYMGTDVVVLNISGTLATQDSQFSAHVAGDRIIFLNTSFSETNTNYTTGLAISLEKSKGRADFDPLSALISGLHKNVNISQNRVFVNATAASGLNVSANLTLNGLIFTLPFVEVDLNDDGSFVLCNEGTNPACFNLSYSGGAFTFNVSHFTTYQVAEPTLTCGIISTPGEFVLTNDVSSNGTCFTVITEDVILDCGDGKIINYGGLGTGIGVNISGVNNVTVKNCIIIKNGSLGPDNFGILYSSSNGSTALNNTIRTNGTFNNDGISVPSSSNGTFLNNTISTDGTSSGNDGISLDTSDANTVFSNNISTFGTLSNRGIRLAFSDNNTVFNNTIFTDGTGSGNNGIHLEGDTASNTVVSNIIATFGTSDNIGIALFDSAFFNTITFNTISTDGTSSGNNGIHLEGPLRSNNITSNTIFTNGTFNNYGITLEGSIFEGIAENNIISSNSITTTGSDSSGIVLFNLTQNNSFTDDEVNASGAEIYADLDLSILFDNTFTHIILEGGPNFTSHSILGVTVDVNKTPPANPPGTANISDYLTIESLGAGSVIDFNLSYTDSDVSGLSEGTLRIYRFNDSTGNWSVLPDSTVDTVNNVVSS